MDRRWLYGVAGVILAAGLAVGSFFLGRTHAEVSDSNLQNEVESLRSKISDAAVIQRVSRQMEDIAYQQKEVSDQQRERAEIQSDLALKMQKKAEDESRAARLAEQNAKEAAAEAEYERANALRLQVEAEQQRDAANYAKSLADTLTYITLGRTLGTMSVDKYESGERKLASKLAYTCWYLMKQYGGNTYQTEIFEPLSMCSKSRQNSYSGKGGGITDICFVPEKGAVYVTDYGEIEYFQPYTGRKTILLQDKKYDFISVLADSESVYALSHHGPLLKTGYDGKTEVIPLQSDTYIGIEYCGAGHILVSSEKSLILYDRHTLAPVKTVQLEKTLSAAAVSPCITYLFFTDGSSAYLGETFILSGFGLQTESAVTAAFCDTLSNTIYMGLDSGSIRYIDRDGNLTEVTSGHNGRITDILCMGDILVSTSYDRSMKIVRLSSKFSLVSVSVPFKSWPLCICSLNNGDLLTGFSDGSLLMSDTSTDSMAEKLKAEGDYYLTEDEWSRYVGTGIPYPSIR